MKTHVELFFNELSIHEVQSKSDQGLNTGSNTLGTSIFNDQRSLERIADTIAEKSFIENIETVSDILDISRREAIVVLLEYRIMKKVSRT